MATLSRRQLESIVAKEKPGYDVVPIGDDEDIQTDALGGDVVDRTPELAELRREFLGDAAEAFETDTVGSIALGGSAAVEDADIEDEAPDDADAEVLLLKPKERNRDAFDRGPGAKTIVVSRKSGQVLAEQG